MIPYNQKEKNTIDVHNKTIFSFNSISKNLDQNTVESFGDEWEKFSDFTTAEINKIGDEYFDIVDDSILNSKSVVLDMGCGSGRWSKYLAPKVNFIEAIDPSNAIFSATRLLNKNNNVRTTQASSDNIPFADETFDFIFSLGVLHHIPDTQQALNDIVKKLKIGNHILIYLYYSLDNRGLLYKVLFKMSSMIRFLVSILPKGIKHFVCDIIAVVIYLPFILFARALKTIFSKNNLYKKIPLSYYIGKSFNVIRNDALDRFGTPLEQRFSREEIRKMMSKSGLTEIKFSENTPYWHAIGKRIT